jgi:AAA15 family ATPase/GTPase
MLIEFRIKNFKSFKDEAILTFVANNADKVTLPNNLLPCPGNDSLKLLNTIVVYGANASGKSTVFQAFVFAREFVKRSAKNSPGSRINVTPYIFDDSKLDASFFEFTFINENVRYQYGFSVTGKAVQKEWLISYPKGRPRKLFERNLENGETSYSFGLHFKGEKDKLVELTAQNALFLSVGATFNNQQLLSVYEWIVKKISAVGPNEIPEPQVFDYILEHPAIINYLKALIGFADLGIVDFTLSGEDLDMSNLPDDLPKGLRNIFETLGKTLVDVDGKPVKSQPKAYEFSILHRSGEKNQALPWEAESDGTKRLFGLGAPIFDALASGKTLFIDEIDRSLHPLLAREIVRLFQNKQSNPNGAQLVFNTHDTSLLSAGLFRRDQVWFLEKDEVGASHLYSLLEFSPRKEDSLEKGYLQGRYGAIPFLSGNLFGGN